MCDIIFDMKKIVFLFLMYVLSPLAFGIDEKAIMEENSIQTRVNKVANQILNSNAYDKRVIFVYDKKSKETALKNCSKLTKRQVLVYDKYYKHIETDDELAAYLSREIQAVNRSYKGIGKGALSSIEMKAAPKKYELIYDKLALDAMVKAGYNPLALIVFINKTCPQARQDKISNKNLTSKRLAYLYERIYFKYPQFLKDNEYINNSYYQNFLLTSQNNRRMIEYKARSKNYGMEIEYE